MFATFRVMEALHELRWYLAEARALTLPSALQARVRAAAEELLRASEGSPDALIAQDVAALRHRIGALLAEVSQQVRAKAGSRRPLDYARADLIEARLADRDLTGATLRGALLIGADLRGAVLRTADLLGRICGRRTCAAPT